MRDRVRDFSSVPDSGTPRAAATVSIRRPTSDSCLAGATTTSGMPASRIWSMASAGPVVVSASTTVGFSDSTLSAETSWARVTTGSFAACSKVAVMSRATTRLPRPRVKTISLSPPVSGTIRSVEATVTSAPSADFIVTGSCGRGAVASGSIRSAAASGWTRWRERPGPYRRRSPSGRGPGRGRRPGCRAVRGPRPGRAPAAGRHPAGRSPARSALGHRPVVPVVCDGQLVLVCE